MEQIQDEEGGHMPTQNLLPRCNDARVGNIGDPGPIRTGDLPLRRGTLYPAELRGRNVIIIAVVAAFGQSDLRYCDVPK